MKNKYEYILLSYSSKQRALKRLNKSSMNVKTIKADSESQAIIKRDNYLKIMDCDLNNFRFVLDKVNGIEV